MTQEDKDLLLKDISARLLYGIKFPMMCWDEEIGETIRSVTLYSINKGGYCHVSEDDYSPYINEIKPYLFPLSSITEEQRNDISQILIDTQNTFSPYGELNMKGCDNLFICTVKQANVLINYCLNNHLDINGLIEKSLALDATGLNIY